MATFLYAPAIKVHVRSEKYGILDISDDIAQWELTRRSNAPSSFNFVLQNPQRKYDQAFQPSDSISVQLKRLVWVPVFTGSLNSVPIFSAWPRALPLSATCSLKKLQFWSWDPTTTESSNMISAFVATLNSSSTQGDSGLSTLISDALVKVTNWDEKAIHIGAVPNDWFKWAQQTELAIDAASNMAAVLGPGTINGASTVGNIHLHPGHYGTANLQQDQVDNASQIYATIIGQGGISTQALQDRAATLALMTALDESGLINLSGGDRTSVGVFQQQEWWGSAEQRMNVQWATLAFLNGTAATGAGGTPKGAHIPGLKNVSWQTGSNLGLICQKVQRSFDNSGSNYAQMQTSAEALVKACRAALTSAVTTGAAATGTLSAKTSASGAMPTGKTSYTGTGATLAEVALRLVNVLNNPHGTIQYPSHASQNSDPRTDVPKYLDCSALVRWVLYHTTGVVWDASDTHTQYPDCAVKDIDMDIASHIQGCLLFGNGTNNMSFGGDPDHVGIAMGDGKTHVASHDMAEGMDQSNLPGGLYSGALAPGIDYSHAATTEAARAWLQSHLKVVCSISTTKLTSSIDPAFGGSYAGTDGGASDPFAQLVSALALNPAVNGDIFGGSRQLMNNQPFLPWVGNLTNSTMRAYCSAPNGDFIAWFPDYFNVWNTAAIMDVKLIELQDFTVEWSDQQIVTHEFVIGSIQPTFDAGSGQIIDGNTSESWSTLSAMLGTEGIATMDFPQIFETIYGKPASGSFVSSYVQRFGARPNMESMPNIIHGAQEFYMALWLFMKHWAEQFSASVPMTFMPELWPGMILRIQEYGFQAYVSQVTHRGSYGQNGGFTTTANIIAPAPIDASLRGSLFGMLDIFGNPSTTTKSS